MGSQTLIGEGVTTLQLAKSIELALDQKLTGLHQVTNGERISKYELIKLFKDICKEIY